MHPIFTNITDTRIYVNSILDGLSNDQLNTVPAGFRNNIIWNAAHLVAAQFSICYVKTGITSLSEEDPFKPFRPGTVPENTVKPDEVLFIKESLVGSVQQMNADWESGKFEAYRPWTNRYRTELKTPEDAFCYVYFHDALHLGVITSIMKLTV